MYQSLQGHVQCLTGLFLTQLDLGQQPPCLRLCRQASGHVAQDTTGFLDPWTGALGQEDLGLEHLQLGILGQLGPLGAGRRRLLEWSQGLIQERLGFADEGGISRGDKQHDRKALKHPVVRRQFQGLPDIGNPLPSSADHAIEVSTRRPAFRILGVQGDDSAEVLQRLRVEVLRRLLIGFQSRVDSRAKRIGRYAMELVHDLAAEPDRLLGVALLDVKADLDRRHRHRIRRLGLEIVENLLGLVVLLRPDANQREIQTGVRIVRVLAHPLPPGRPPLSSTRPVGSRRASAACPARGRARSADPLDRGDAGPRHNPSPCGEP